MLVPDKPYTCFLGAVVERWGWGRSQLLAVRMVSNFGFELPQTLKRLLRNFTASEILKYLELLELLAIYLKKSVCKVFQVIYPFCHEPLAKNLLTSRAQSTSFEELHSLVFPKRLPKNIYYQFSTKYLPIFRTRTDILRLLQPD